VVEASLDFASRTSSNSKYVSPTRGQLGNALKCVVAAPAVRFPGEGAGVTITARGVEHRIVIVPDPIAQDPKVEHRKRAVVKTGTSVRVDWPGIAKAGATATTTSLFTTRTTSPPCCIQSPRSTRTPRCGSTAS
jgi:hypothetical protein